MEFMIRAKDNGVHRAFMERVGAPPDDPHDGVRVCFGGAGGAETNHHPARNAVSCLLRQFRGQPGAKIERLLPFQVEAVLNMVFRPEKTSVSKTIMGNYRSSGTRVTQYATSALASTEDDIGMMAINDLFTGSGKTLVTILGAIIFAKARRQEIVKRAPLLVREQVRESWSTRIQVQSTSPSPSESSSLHPPAFVNAVVVMCAKHLVPQWRAACASALHILRLDKTVDVLENPMPGSIRGLRDSETPALKILLLHSAANLDRLQLGFVPVIVVDEFTIRSASNVLTKPAEVLPLHGRLLLVSADAGNARNVIHGAHRRSFLRRLVEWDDISHLSDSRIALSAGIPLISASVLQTEDRYAVGDFMVNRLRQIAYEKYVVIYTPSFASRLFGNNFEMSALSGSRLITERFGLVLTGTNTIEQLLRIVSDAVDTLVSAGGGGGAGGQTPPSAAAPLARLRDKISKFVGEREDCPICMEEYDMGSGASLLNPCWHILCDKCLRNMMDVRDHRCPLCRTRIEGHTTAAVAQDGDGGSAEESDSSHAPPPAAQIRAGASLFENMNARLKPTLGLEKACIEALMCIKADVGTQSFTAYKIVMIVPDEHFFTKFQEGLRETPGAMDGIQIVEFKTVGNKRKHITGKIVAGQIQAFADDQGPPIKILFTTEGKTDSLTGLDFPTVDCILSLGDGNSLQRLGRLTRLPRMMDQASAGKTVRYVCLEPAA